MKLIVSVSLAIVLCISLSTAASAGVKWIDANGSPCDEVCSSHQMRAIKSGTAPWNGQHFYVCSAEGTQNSGYRAGFNLRPNYSNVCSIGYDKELQVKSYKCLCE